MQQYVQMPSGLLYTIQVTVSCLFTFHYILVWLPVYGISHIVNITDTCVMELGIVLMGKMNTYVIIILFVVDIFDVWEHKSSFVYIPVQYVMGLMIAHQEKMNIFVNFQDNALNIVNVWYMPLNVKTAISLW